jgi:uroporphyrinogen decarboxylase
MCLTLWERLAARVDFDLIECWEDMSFKSGPMVSPAIFERFLAPHYKKIRAFADAHRIPIVLVDSDGNTEALARWMAEAGVNAMYPFEVQAGNDVARVLSGLPGFAALGGVDKNCMAGEPLAADVLRAIEREMEKAERLIRGGRFVPGPDHFVLSDVPFENYERFMKRLREVVLATRPGTL